MRGWNFGSKPIAGVLQRGDQRRLKIAGKRDLSVQLLVKKQVGDLAARFQFAHHRTCHVLQGLDLHLTKIGPWVWICHADDADTITLWRNDRHTYIIADARRPGDQPAVFEPRIFCGIRHDQPVIARDCVSAKGFRAWEAMAGESSARTDHHLIAIDKRD
jgi:hypothetical protein